MTFIPDRTRSGYDGESTLPARGLKGLPGIGVVVIIVLMSVAAALGQWAAVAALAAVLGGGPVMVITVQRGVGIPGRTRGWAGGFYRSRRCCTAN
ncbi:hypothetical protein ABTX60_15035 [Streptomyces sp. NPDC126510]|uniref:hypothetical protein n=1 Tax=Streptomyces sp. NPDC126510 TaxID=3155317 RepID=UPI00331B8A30